MQFDTSSRKQWGGYLILLMTAGLAAWTRNSPRDTSVGYPTNKERNSYSVAARSSISHQATSTQKQSDRYRSRRWALLILPVFAFLLAIIGALSLLADPIRPVDMVVSSEDPLDGALLQVNTRVTDQRVIIERVITPEPSWVVIYRTLEDRQPTFTEPLGLIQVEAGESEGIRLSLNHSVAAGDSLAAVLHVDAGKRGFFEYPYGPDQPLLIDGRTVTTVFTPQVETASR